MTTKKIAFKRPARFDAGLAAEGVPHMIVDDNGTYFGTFTTRFADPDNKALQAHKDKYQREHGKDKEARGKLAGVYNFVHVFLVDWEGVEDEDGNAVDFSPEAAFALLGDEDEDTWLYRRLCEVSVDARNYAPSLATKKADIAKN